MHPNKTSHRLDTIEEALITDLRSLKAVLALLKDKYPRLHYVHISREAFAKIWTDAQTVLFVQYQPARDAYRVSVQGVYLASKDGDYLWDASYLMNLAR